MIVALGLAALASMEARSQSYTLIDLTPTAGNGVATGIDAGVAAGYTADAIFGTLTRATLWTDAGTVDLHPTSFDNAVTGAPGRSAVLDMVGNLQVGWAAGVSTANRPVPVLWRGSSGSASLLPIPFTNFGGQAQATDGIQVVGHAIGLDRDGVAQGPNHAMIWDAATGAATDLGDGGNGAAAYGVGVGQQVGMIVKSQSNAALWLGSLNSLINLHPKGAVLSFANATDGARQAGYAGFDIRVRQEAAKGNKTQRFNYAYVWSGSAVSGLNIHSYPENNFPGVSLSQSYALGIKGSLVVGYAGDQTKFGTPAYSHAMVWNLASNQCLDLNEFLPAGFVGAQATSVDADGNISGFMAKADGTRHAVVWVSNPAQ